jgi:Bacterial extracellular solute-binding proteins, family 5 Middle
MKRRLYLCLAVSSVLFASVVRVQTARRPAYGGTLRVDVGGVVNSLDPAVTPANPEEAQAQREIDALIYERGNPDGTFAGVAGSGPFRISAWDPGKHVTLAANDDYPAGRPFVDSIEFQMGRSANDRLLDLEVSAADFAEIPAEQARQAVAGGVRVSASHPDRLLALVFIAGRPAVQDARLRQALSESIDRSAIVDFILQKEGEPAGGLLPQWSSGTAFLFATAADTVGAKALVSQIGSSPALVLGYDFGDSFEQSVAERIAIDAHAAGLTVTAQPIRPGGAIGASGTAPDARLIRLSMPTPSPRDSLAKVLATLEPIAGLDAISLPEAASPEQIYAAERSVLDGYRVVPLVWYPQVYGLSARVRDWQAPAPGAAWPFADVWLDGPVGAVPQKDNP